MSKVVLKGEIHTSSGDLEEEKELVKQGFDVIVIEGQAGPSDYGWADGWFQLSLGVFFWLVGRIYVSKDILVDLAEAQDSTVVYTRQADSDILNNTSRVMKLASASVFYLLVSGSVAVGLVFNEFRGAAVFFAGVAFPVLGIRIVNSRQSRGQQSRDKLIADKIMAGVDEGQTVLAIVGASHIDGVVNYLPDDIELDVWPPVYSRISKQHLKETALPFMEVLLVLYSLYLVVSGVLIQIARLILMV